MNGSSKDEYTDISANMRQYGNMRFAQLTIFIAITASLVNVLLGKDNPPSTGAIVALKIGGLIALVVFWIMEERAADYWHHYRKRAIELEEVLGYRQYSTKAPRKFGLLSATNAIRLFFVAVGVFWALSLIFPSLF